jgi:membrane protein DedA with SNARE-associated domain
MEANKCLYGYELQAGECLPKEMKKLDTIIYLNGSETSVKIVYIYIYIYIYIYKLILDPNDVIMFSYGYFLGTDNKVYLDMGFSIVTNAFIGIGIGSKMN